jgi:hypothetical protein
MLKEKEGSRNRYSGFFFELIWEAMESELSLILPCRRENFMGMRACQYEPLMDSY